MGLCIYSASKRKEESPPKKTQKKPQKNKNTQKPKKKKTPKTQHKKNPSETLFLVFLRRDNIVTSNKTNKKYSKKRSEAGPPRAHHSRERTPNFVTSFPRSTSSSTIFGKNGRRTPHHLFVSAENWPGRRRGGQYLRYKRRIQ